MCLERTYSTIAQYPEFFFFFFLIFLMHQKLTKNEKSYIFQEIGIPEIHVRLSENFQNLIALQV